MNARLERKLRFFAAIIVVGTLAGLAANLAQGRSSPTSMLVGAGYGFLMCISIGTLELFVFDGRMREWLNDLSFTANLLVRSAIYAAIITLIQSLQLGEVIAGMPRDPAPQTFWSGFALSAAIAVAMNLGFSIANIIGPQALLNFVTGRYHSPVEENRFVLFVDIAGSTGLAERLGGIGIHRFLDRAGSQCPKAIGRNACNRCWSSLSPISSIIANALTWVNCRR
jgi:adenylate cyclase